MTEHAPPSLTREQLIQQIRYAIEQLAPANGAHRFEELCRHFARKTIAPNILPATGPVAGGGDQGRDFETFHSYLREELGPSGGFAGRVSDAPVAFACTLQRDALPAKLRSDVAKIMASGTAVARIYAFTGADLRVDRRHALQEEVRDEYAVELEIIDGKALAEALADHETFPLAEEFLSIPAMFRPPAPAAAPGTDDTIPGWYVADRERWRQRGRVVPLLGELLDVIDGLRHATFAPPAREDLPFWLGLVRPLCTPDVPRDVRQRARYEVAVAQLRGLGDLTPADGVARDFLVEVMEDEEPARLADAAVLLAYAGTAAVIGHSGLDPRKLGEINDRLRAHVVGLLDRDPPPVRRASLLHVLGHLALLPDARADAAQGRHGPEVADAATLLDELRDATVAPHDAAERWTASDIAQTMAAWGELAGLLESTPLFPVEPWAAQLSFLRPVLMRHAGWEEIEDAVDAAVARVRGGDAAAQRARERAIALHQDGRLRDALAQVHRAKDLWWSGDNLRAALESMLMAAEIYGALRLPQAARFYALAAATGANSSGDHDLSNVIPHALLTASRLDYAAGDWLAAVELADIGLQAQAALVDPEVDPYSSKDLRDAVLTLGMALRAARQLRPELAEAIEAVARRHGILEQLDRVDAEIEDWSPDAWAALADEQLGGRPFSDLGQERTIRFAALGIRWVIRAASDYVTTRAAERLAAATQLLLVELADDDLCLLPCDIEIEVEVDDGESVTLIEGEAARRFVVRLTPLTPGTPLDPEPIFAETLSVLNKILLDVSLLPAAAYLQAMERAFARGLGHKLAVARPYDEVAEIVTERRYSQTARDVAPPLEAGRPGPGEHPELAWQDGPGPTYRADEARETVARRYERIPELVGMTLERLRADPGFLAVLQELRDHGWLDWHVLTGIVNVVLNHRMELAGLNTIEAVRAPGARERLATLQATPDTDDDPAVPLELFTAEHLDFHRKGAIPSFMAGWGLEIRQRVPDMDAFDRLLGARYGYWSDDIEHEDPVVPVPAPSGPAA